MSHFETSDARPGRALPRPAAVALWASVGLAAVALGGCRADGGPDDYQSQEALRLDAEPPPIDASLREGERRFNLGAFYEGPADEAVIIDDVSAHFYIYEDTFAPTVEAADRVEGSTSDRLVLRGGPWWGGGVHWDTPRDLSGWATLNVSLKSSDASQAGFKLAMNNADESQAVVDLAPYGFVADGQWHDLVIPLSAYAEAGADLTQVGAPLVFVGGAGEAGQSVLIDGVFLSNL